MTLNAEQKAEIWHHYDTWMTGYLNADVETYDAYFDDDYHFIGSTNNEEFLNRKDTTKFFELTGEQFAGITALRNETKILEAFGTSVFLTHVFDGWFLHDKEWTYYGRFRFSSVMQKKEAGWRFIYQHFSMPDLKSDEGQTIGYENITAENFELKEAIKRRTIELEVKNKELEIEAALERVRSRSMGMHKSDELNDVVAILFEKLKELKIPFTAVGIGIFIEGSKDLDSFVCGQNEDGLVITNYRLPYFDNRIPKDLYNAIEKQLDFFVGHYSKEEKDAFYEYVIEHTAEFRHLPEDIKRMIFDSETYTISMVAVQHAVFNINDFEGKVLAESEIDIIQRFARVFDQAYTRFLDLQKAETQAKEAKIEAALERVRSRTMAMQSSAELGAVAAELFAQMNQLVTNLWTCGFVLCEKDRDEDEWWLSMDGDFTRGFFLPNVGDFAHATLFEGWLKGEALRAVQLDGEALQQHYDWLMEIPVSRAIFEEMDAAGLARPDWQKLHAAYFSKGYLVLITREPCGEEEIFRRFAQVFDQTYTRFLDLQKAEAQTREAQINLAVERVRAKALAMFKSEEILQVVHKLKAEIMGLNIPNVAAATIHLKEPDGMCRVWDLTSLELDDEGLHLPLDIRFRMEDTHPGFFMRRVWENNEDYFVVVQEETDFKHTIQWLRDSGLNEQANEAEAFFKSAQLKKVYHPTVPLNNGRMCIDLLDTPSPEVASILTKMAGAFDLAYKRFEDLQKAEAQAREAKIEAALEKVRSRSLAMNKAEELGEVVTVVVEKLRELDFPVNDGVALVTYVEGSKDLVEWMENPGFPSAIKFYQPYFEHAVLSDFWKAKNEGLDFVAPRYTAEENRSFLEHIFEYGDYKNTLQEVKDYCLAAYTYSYAVAFQKNSSIFINDYSGRSLSASEIDILKRFSKVFEQAYIRFLDLQKAEAQTREAQIQLALERVRARTMAMNTQSDLLGVIELFGSQLISLGLRVEYSSFINGSITKNRDWELWGYSPTSNEPPKKVIIPYIETPYFTKTAKNIDEFERTGNPIQVKSFTKEEKDAFFAHYWKFDPPATDEAKNYLSATPGSMIIDAFLEEVTVSILKFETEPYSEEQIDIFKRFSNEFRQTYIRFLDLQKAEAQAKEAQIEAALERVRSRSLAMHKTDELQEVVRVVAEELKNTGVILDTWGAVICTYFQDSKDVLHWTASEDPANPSFAFLLPYFKDELYDEAWGSKNRGDSYFAKVFSFDVKNAFFKHAFEHSDYRHLPDDYKKLILESQNHGIAWAWAKNSAIMIPSIQGDLPSEDEKEILIRFAKVFEQSFIRFLDLQKAEAQAKEAQIELSLERIRSQVTAMQESSDLLDIVVTMRTEFVKLGHEAHYFWHMRWLLEQYDKAMTSGDGTKIGMVMTLPRHIHGDIPLVADWEKTKEPTVVLAMDVETAVDYVEKMITLGDFEQVDPQAPTLDDIRHIGGLTFVMARTTHGEIGYSLPGVVTNPPKDAVDTLVRFAGVFDLAYKRFEDLKAAERQHREAQIELALERVRARTMAMQHSDELADASQVLDQQVRALGIETWGCAFHIYADNAEGDYEWFSSANGNLPFYKTPREKFFLNFYEKGQQGEKFYVEEFKGEDCKAHYDFLKTIPVMGDALLDLEASGIPLPAYQIDHIAFFQQGYILFITYKPAPEAHDIFKRFAKVFEQTYTRFLDLQKSESQAKEAKIEAALERVRAASMAMHKSEELQDVIKVVAHQITELGIHFNTANFTRINEDMSWEMWITTPEQPYPSQIHVPFFEHRLMRRMTLMNKKNADAWTDVCNKEEKDRFFYHFFENTIARHIPDERKNFVFSTPGMVISTFVTKNIMLSVAIYECSPFTEEENKIFNRFAKVFEQTYTRFLDLKKAEAQTREAKIEAALERTRTQSMLMQHSGELNEISKTFHEQLLLLGIDSEFSFVWLPDEEKNEHMFWATWVSEDTGVGQYHSRAINYPLDKTEPGTAACYVAWESSEPVHETFVPPGDIVSFFAAWEELLTGAEKIRPEFFPDGIYYTEAYMKYGCFGIDIRRRLDADEKEIIRRFAVEFERTYTRFLDLKKAEAQAMEAIKRATVDRVRAEIASMRTTTDLERIQPLIWNELTTLGVPFIRCGVFILMEEKREVQAFLSTPDGKSIAAFHLPYDATEQTKKIVAHWQQKQLFKDHMDEKAFAEYTQNLVQQGAMARDEKYVTENRPTDLYLHFLPFLQGMMYVGNNAPLNEDELQLVQNLADAFSTAYARYEDFNKLEAAKAAVESAMGELKATQSQLVQQEKLASLGQLTAGIAHEIKNPLNFVNNFTEVSIELIEEALEEILKHDDEKDSSLINQNLEDIKSNLKKVYDHGTRANSIVNSMLMHSRGGGGSPEPTPLNDFIREYSNLAFHGMRASKDPVNVQMVLELDEKVKHVPLIVEDFSRVVLNICNNAFDAMREKKKKYEVRNTKYEVGEGGNENYLPKLSIQTKLVKGNVLIHFEDNALGIPDEIKDKILQPFFTTKKGTEGTGLGLSISNDIVKAHGGELKVEAKEGHGSVFSIVLPI